MSHGSGRPECKPLISLPDMIWCASCENARLCRTACCTVQPGTCIAITALLRHAAAPCPTALLRRPGLAHALPSSSTSHAGQSGVGTGAACLGAAEVKYGSDGKSRVDFVLHGDAGATTHVEVKSVTLAEDTPVGCCFGE